MGGTGAVPSGPARSGRTKQRDNDERALAGNPGCPRSRPRLPGNGWSLFRWKTHLWLLYYQGRGPFGLEHDSPGRSALWPRPAERGVGVGMPR